MYNEVHLTKQKGALMFVERIDVSNMSLVDIIREIVYESKDGKPHTKRVKPYDLAFMLNVKDHLTDAPFILEVDETATIKIIAQKAIFGKIAHLPSEEVRPVAFLHMPLADFIAALEKQHLYEGYNAVLKTVARKKLSDTVCFMSALLETGYAPRILETTLKEMPWKPINRWGRA